MLTSRLRTSIPPPTSALSSSSPFPRRAPPFFFFLSLLLCLSPLIYSRSCLSSVLFLVLYTHPSSSPPSHTSTAEESRSLEFGPSRRVSAGHHRPYTTGHWSTGLVRHAGIASPLQAVLARKVLAACTTGHAGPLLFRGPCLTPTTTMRRHGYDLAAARIPFPVDLGLDPEAEEDKRPPFRLSRRVSSGSCQPYAIGDRSCPLRRSRGLPSGPTVNPRALTRLSRFTRPAT